MEAVLTWRAWRGIFQGGSRATSSTSSRRTPDTSLRRGSPLIASILRLSQRHLHHVGKAWTPCRRLITHQAAAPSLR